ncbi:MAG: hypothetical protein AMXMBFR53_32520 [Gemmatimonadota bacterium]
MTSGTNTDGGAGPEFPATPPGESHPPASLPTPVRASLGSIAPPEPEGSGDKGGVPAREKEVEVAGTVWTVRTLGRSMGGPPSAPVPLLLLGFFAHPGDERPALEALVVGRGLDDLTEEHLEAAHRASQAPPPEGVRKPLFPEIGTKGDRRDG